MLDVSPIHVDKQEGVSYKPTEIIPVFVTLATSGKIVNFVRLVVL